MAQNSFYSLQYIVLCLLSVALIIGIGVSEVDETIPLDEKYPYRRHQTTATYLNVGKRRARRFTVDLSYEPADYKNISSLESTSTMSNVDTDEDLFPIKYRIGKGRRMISRKANKGNFVSTNDFNVIPSTSTEKPIASTSAKALKRKKTTRYGNKERKWIRFKI